MGAPNLPLYRRGNWWDAILRKPNYLFCFSFFISGSLRGPHPGTVQITGSLRVRPKTVLSDSPSLALREGTDKIRPGHPFLHFIYFLMPDRSQARRPHQRSGIRRAWAPSAEPGFDFFRHGASHPWLHRITWITLQTFRRNEPMDDTRD